MVLMNLIAYSLAAAATIAGTLPALGENLLAPHRAVYDIALESTTDRSGITGIAGRMVYEFNGSPCEGYTVNFRFVTEVQSDEVTRLTDQQTTTWEDPSGRSFAFASRSYIDRQLDSELRGTATAQDSGTVVELVKPAEGKYELSAALFPTQHMVDLLQRIERGETFYETSIFDGSDEADEVLTTTVIVGKPQKISATDPEAAAARDLAAETYWPVSIAYFEEYAERGEEVPIYRIAFKLYQNGITRSILMDYGDFAMKGSLVELELFEQAADCRD